MSAGKILLRWNAANWWSYLFALWLAWSLVAPAASAQALVARQITAQNLAELTPQGLDAIGGVGDWLLSNGTLCAVISAPGHQTYMSLHGGTLVDLWHCDRGNDQWVTLHEQRNLDKAGISTPREIAASLSPGLAELQVVGERDGIETTTRYQLAAASSTSLQVTYELRRTAEGDALNMLGFIMLHPRAALVPFTLNQELPEFSVGASQPYIDTRDFTNVLANVAPPSLRVLAGVPGVEPAISYGVAMTGARLRDEEGRERPVQRFLIGSETFTNIGLFSEPFLLPASTVPGALNFLRGQFMDIEIGEVLIVDLEITVGDRADAASVTDQIYSGREIRGRVDAAPAGITVKDDGGNVITFARCDGDGRFALRLPRDVVEFQLQVETAWSRSSYTFGEDAPQDLGTLATGAYGVVHLPDDIGPASLVFKGQGDTADPVLFNTLTGLSVGGERTYTARETNRINLAGLASDPKLVRLAPGRYRVIATRGIEYSLSDTLIELRPDEKLVLDLGAPQRAVATPGLVAADFHLHSGISMDSNITPEQRVRDFVAQGGEVLVASEHNITVDFSALVQAMGLADQVLALPGVELTGLARSEIVPMTIGHANVFPVIADSGLFLGGTLPFEGKRLGKVIGDYKAQFPQSVFQLNHPRTDAYDSDLSFFNHLSQGEPFDATLSLDESPNSSLLQTVSGSRYRDLDFDAMELLNGESIGDYLLIREDWFSLLRQGEFKVGTANSDSHLSTQLVAMPRTYLKLAAELPGELTAAQVSSALMSGNVIGTSGPMITVTLGTVEPGQTYIGKLGSLQVAVAAAPWVGVDELRVFSNGELVESLPITAGDSRTVVMEFDTDSFVTVEVSGPVTEDYAAVAPGYQSIAFSNPIFVDSDGNGYRQEQ